MSPPRTDWTLLVVDDMPDNIGPLHDTLEDAGHTVLVALDGPSALERAQQTQPDLILLDAIMPGMDGFETARRLKAHPSTAHIPIVFMTGLTDTEHLERALAVGGVDYVTKPVNPREVMARIGAHVRNAHCAPHGQRQQVQARNALDAFGYATITFRASDAAMLWQTPLARQWLSQHFADEVGPHAQLTPAAVARWLAHAIQVAQTLVHSADGPVAEPPRLNLRQGEWLIGFRLHQQIDDDEWLVVMQASSEDSVLHQLSQALNLTLREAEVLYWVTKGKINRDIADIVGASPATVKKHLERIHAKLGVETRTAAAAMALQKVPGLRPVQ